MIDFFLNQVRWQFKSDESKINTYTCFTVLGSTSLPKGSEGREVVQRSSEGVKRSHRGTGVPGGLKGLQGAPDGLSEPLKVSGTLF